MGHHRQYIYTVVFGVNSEKPKSMTFTSVKDCSQSCNLSTDTVVKYANGGSGYLAKHLKITRTKIRPPDASKITSIPVETC
jgi:hypothetical protein